LLHRRVPRNWASGSGAPIVNDAPVLVNPGSSSGTIWTYSLIPHIEGWTRCPLGKLEFQRE
jgi:hypothetical protein